MEQTLEITRRAEFLNGAKRTLPLIAGAIPFGIIYGALAINAGMSPLEAQGMSLFVFAGSAQFIAAGLIAGGTGLVVIVLTTFIVNLRHALYSASLAPYMRHLPQRWLMPLGFWLTDETYAISILRYKENDNSPYKHWFVFGSALFMYVNWQICTAIGIAAGQIIGDGGTLGFDFAMSVTFIGIVVPLIVDRPMLVCAIVSGAVALATQGLPNNLWLILAAITGIIAGFTAEVISPKAKFTPDLPEKAQNAGENV